MANAAIWWWPTNALVATKIDLEGPLNDLQVSPAHDTQRRQSQAGRAFTTMYQNRRAVRLVRKFTAASASVTLINSLKSLEDHLNRGGWCSVVDDEDKAWAGYVKTKKIAGRQVVRTAGNPFWNSSATIAVDDVVAIQSFGPNGVYQQSSVSVVTSQSKITISPGLHEEHRGDVIVRYEAFFPYLRLKPGNNAVRILASDHRHIWTLEMDLIEDVSHTDATGTIAASSFVGGMAPDRIIGRRLNALADQTGGNKVAGKGNLIGAFGVKLP